MKKGISIILAAILLAASPIRYTYAQLTDREGVTNQFTARVTETEPKINITLPVDAEDGWLIPITSVKTDDTNTFRNSIKYKAYVKCEEDSDPVYVRVHVAVAAQVNNLADRYGTGKWLIDEFGDAYESYGQYSIFSFDHDGYQHKGVTNQTLVDSYNSQWTWKNAPETKTPTYRFTDSSGTEYNVYVVTYKSVLETGKTTGMPFIRSVYLDSAVTNYDLYAGGPGGPSIYPDAAFNIYCQAQAVTAEGFADAETALNTAFGNDPADCYGMEWE